MNEFAYDISLRIKHPSLDPNDVCTKLGLSADVKWCLGDRKTTPKGTPLDGIYDHSYCVFRLKRLDSPSLSNHISKQCEILSEFKEYFRSIVESGGTIEFFVGWYSGRNTGEVFTWRLLDKLSQLHIDLGLDVYCDETSPTKSTD